MNQNENIMEVEKPFSFTGLNKLSAAIVSEIVSEETIFRVKRRANDLVAIMKNTINNFLKTPEEIEAEFCLVRNSYLAVSDEQHSGTDDTPSKHKDGFMNIHNPEEVFNLSGFMEENY